MFKRLQKKVESQEALPVSKDQESNDCINEEDANNTKPVDFEGWILDRLPKFYGSDEGDKKLHFLAKHGLADILETLGSTSTDSGIGEPLLHTACRRDLPNMAVLGVLVEKFRVDVNAKSEAEEPEDEYEDAEPGGMSALHYLANGYHWWQAAQGIPYLVTQSGADKDLRNEGGKTPLRIALGS
jgi:hypothetical protein